MALEDEGEAMKGSSEKLMLLYHSAKDACHDAFGFLNKLIIDTYVTVQNLAPVTSGDYETSQLPNIMYFNGNDSRGDFGGKISLDPISESSRNGFFHKHKGAVIGGILAAIYSSAGVAWNYHNMMIFDIYYKIFFPVSNLMDFMIWYLRPSVNQAIVLPVVIFTCVGIGIGASVDRRIRRQ